MKMEEHLGENPGIIANRYKVVKTLGGGMGLVHCCLDMQDNNNPVAIKTYKPEFLSNRAIRDRFLREATIWVDLGFHPNIVQAYQVLHFADNQSVYIIMQLIPTPTGLPDPSLRAQLILGSPLKVERSLGITLGIIRGMKYAESKFPTLVHRDLKPENILIGTDDQPKITDFGLAGVRSNHTESKSSNTFNPYLRNITQAGILGTPLYMSPEQWLGREVDCRSDIYALGCILFEMLTGQLAVMANGPEELCMAHCSGMALQNVIRSSLNPPLKEILRKCLSLHYNDRPTSWKDFEAEIEHLIVNEYHGQIPDDEQVIDISLYGQYQKIESFLAIGAAYINIGNFIDGKGYFEKAQYIAEQQGFSILQALAMANQGVALSNQGYFERAIELLKEAVIIFQEHGEYRQVCYHTGNIGNAFLGLNDLPNAELYLEKASQLAEKSGDTISMARTIGNLGNVYLAKGNNNLALRQFQTALAISQNTKDRSSISKHMGGIASAYERLGEIQKAKEYYQLSLNEAHQIGDRQSEGIIYLSIGGLAIKLHNIHDGIANMSVAVDIGREINDKLLIAKALGNLASAYVYIKQTKTAIPLLEESIKVAKDIDAYDVCARAYMSLGLAYELQQDFRDAISYLREAVVKFKALNMPEYQQASDHLKQLRKALGLL